MTNPIEELRLEAIRSRAFIRSAETQLDKVINLIDELETPVPEEPPAIIPYPFEPASHNILTERNFLQLTENGWRDEIVPDRFSIVSDSTAPTEIPLVGRMRYPAGFEGGWAPAWAESSIHTKAKQIYVSFWFKLSENWQNHPVATKILYLWTHDNPVVTPVIVGTDTLITEVRIQDVPGGARNLTPRTAGEVITPGRWHQWELLLANNSGGNSTGEVHWWIDQHNAGSYFDVKFSRADQNKFWEMIAWRPTWGGHGGTVKEDMFMSMAHIYVSGR